MQGVRTGDTGTANTFYRLILSVGSKHKEE